MGNTPNNNFPFPESTDLVKDGAQAIEDLADAIDTTLGVYSPDTPMGVHLSTVTFSAVSSVSLPADTFTSTYKNYKLVFNLTSCSDDMSVSIRYRTAGTDNSSATYFQSIFATTNWTTATFSAYNATTDTSHQFVLAPRTASGHAILIVDIMNPFETLRTSYAGMGVSGNESRALTGFFNNTTSFDSASLIASTGNFTGAYSIYAYNA
jgi:hypothetical protein